MFKAFLKKFILQPWVDKVQPKLELAQDPQTYRPITQPTSMGAKLNCHISNQVTTLGPLSISVTSRGRKIVPMRDSALGEPAI